MCSGLPSCPHCAGKKRQTDNNGEMTIGDWIYSLPHNHSARKEWAEIQQKLSNQGEKNG